MLECLANIEAKEVKADMPQKLKVKPHQKLQKENISPKKKSKQRKPKEESPAKIGEGLFANKEDFPYKRKLNLDLYSTSKASEPYKCRSKL